MRSQDLESPPFNPIRPDPLSGSLVPDLVSTASVEKYSVAIPLDPIRSDLLVTPDIKGKGIMYEDDDEPIQLVELEDSHITGLPLHLWNVDNLKRIGGRLGHIDTMELEEGRMLIDIDSRKPLQFTRKVTLGDKEVTIQIAYDLLFRHCSTCGRLTHEKEYCPVVKEEPRAQIPSKRAGVFARVQVPHEHYDRQPLQRNQSLRDREHDRQVDVLSRQTDVSRTRDNRDIYQGTHMNQYRGLNNSKHDSHYDRIIRARDERPRSNRYGGSRFGNKPYDRFGKEELTWREKAKKKASVGSGSRDVVPYEHKPNNKPLLITEDSTYQNVNHRNRGERSGKVEPTWREKAKEKVSEGSGSMDVVPYERTPTIKPLSIIENRTYRSEGHRNRGERSGKRLASAIVTPSRQPHSMEDTVTTGFRAVV
ncbi:hypothetical protein YC2023_053286 [Brassica napus]